MGTAFIRFWALCRTGLQPAREAYYLSDQWPTQTENREDCLQFDILFWVTAVRLRMTVTSKTRKPFWPESLAARPVGREARFLRRGQIGRRS